MLSRIACMGAVASAVMVGLALFTTQSAQAESAVGAVFVATNSVDENRGNEVVMFNRSAVGTLSVQGRFPTGGFGESGPEAQGSGPGIAFRGDALASQGSMVVSEDQRYLLVTNFMSHNVTVFKIERTGLVRTDLQDSGGTFPVGVAIYEDLVYVLNTGDGGNVTGFRLSDDGRLIPLSRSTRELNADGPQPPDGADGFWVVFAPSEIQFSPDGRQLVVIIKEGIDLNGTLREGPGRIDIYRVRNNGRLRQNPTSNESSGSVPFAMNFSDNGRNLYVVEALGQNPTAAISSYRVRRNGTLRRLTESLNLGQLDSCWIVRRGSYLYTADFLSDTISRIEILPNGRLTDPVIAATTSAGSFNLDMAITSDGNYLYNVLPGVGAIAAFAIDSDGDLISLGEFPGFEPTPDQEPTEPFTDGGSPAGMAIADFEEVDDVGDDDDDDDDDEDDD